MKTVEERLHDFELQIKKLENRVSDLECGKLAYCTKKDKLVPCILPKHDNSVQCQASLDDKDSKYWMERAD